MLSLHELPEAVPQQGGTHQAEEKILLMTSGGKRVTFLWICSRLSTRAKNTPTENSMAPRITRLVVLLVITPIYGPREGNCCESLAIAVNYGWQGQGIRSCQRTKQLYPPVIALPKLLSSGDLSYIPSNLLKKYNLL